MEEDFRTRLKSAGDLAAKVGTHIDWGLRPQRETLSALTLTTAGGAPAYTYKGRSRLRQTRVQIDIWSATGAQALIIGCLLPPIIEPPAIVGATHFGASFVTLDQDAGTEDMAGGGIAFRRIMEFAVWHRPAV